MFPIAIKNFLWLSLDLLGEQLRDGRWTTPTWDIIISERRWCRACMLLYHIAKVKAPKLVRSIFPLTKQPTREHRTIISTCVRSSFGALSGLSIHVLCEWLWKWTYWIPFFEYLNIVMILLDQSLPPFFEFAGCARCLRLVLHFRRLLSAWNHH